ncbi:Mps one binder kinase activator-like [Musa troglodytarum]|uniref:Mps one binder kinase activator-like n=1 Tax=Musa troglodytarum TaxID=320322 RepID=A0A9E7HSW0_9LILI|nr:Mps one binder kinase activator-like [Musa troglodytarum]
MLVREIPAGRGRSGAFCGDNQMRARQLGADPCGRARDETSCLASRNYSTQQPVAAGRGEGKAESAGRQLVARLSSLVSFSPQNNPWMFQRGRTRRNQKTFRPKKNAPSGNKGAQLKRHIDATLGSGNLREAVRLPPGEDINEWLAVNTVDFFNQVNILYGTLAEFCTPTSCPTMSAGPKFEYRWADGVQIRKPIEVSAPKYVDYLMDWIEAQLDNESIFPQRLGSAYALQM